MELKYILCNSNNSNNLLKYTLVGGSGGNEIDKLKLLTVVIFELLNLKTYYVFPLQNSDINKKYLIIDFFIIAICSIKYERYIDLLQNNNLQYNLNRIYSLKKDNSYNYIEYFKTKLRYYKEDFHNKKKYCLCTTILLLLCNGHTLDLLEFPGDWLFANLHLYLLQHQYNITNFNKKYNALPVQLFEQVWAKLDDIPDELYNVVQMFGNMLCDESPHYVHDSENQSTNNVRVFINPAFNSDSEIGESSILLQQQPNQIPEPKPKPELESKPESKPKPELESKPKPVQNGGSTLPDFPIPELIYSANKYAHYFTKWRPFIRNIQIENVCEFLLEKPEQLLFDNIPLKKTIVYEALWEYMNNLYNDYDGHTLYHIFIQLFIDKLSTIITQLSTIITQLSTIITQLSTIITQLSTIITINISKLLELFNLIHYQVLTKIILSEKDITHIVETTKAYFIKTELKQLLLNLSEQISNELIITILDTDNESVKQLPFYISELHVYYEELNYILKHYTNIEKITTHLQTLQNKVDQSDSRERLRQLKKIHTLEDIHGAYYVRGGGSDGNDPLLEKQDSHYIHENLVHSGLVPIQEEPKLRRHWYGWFDALLDHDVLHFLSHRVQGLVKCYFTSKDQKHKFENSNVPNIKIGEYIPFVLKQLLENSTLKDKLQNDLLQTSGLVNFTPDNVKQLQPPQPHLTEFDKAAINIDGLNGSFTDHTKRMTVYGSQLGDNTQSDVKSYLTKNMYPYFTGMFIEDVQCNDLVQWSLLLNRYHVYNAIHKDLPFPLKLLPAYKRKLQVDSDAFAKLITENKILCMMQIKIMFYFKQQGNSQVYKPYFTHHNFILTDELVKIAFGNDHLYNEVGNYKYNEKFEHQSDEQLTRISLQLMPGHLGAIQTGHSYTSDELKMLQYFDHIELYKDKDPKSNMYYAYNNKYNNDHSAKQEEVNSLKNKLDLVQKTDINQLFI